MEQKDLEMFANIVSKAIEPLNDRFDKLEGRFDNLEGRFDNLEGRFDNLEGRFENLEGKFDKLEKKVDHLDLDVRDIKLSIDNEINPKINIIAEGRLNLNRKLDYYISNVLKVEREYEQLNLRMIHQESELIKVKARLDGSTQTA